VDEIDRCFLSLVAAVRELGVLLAARRSAAFQPTGVNANGLVDKPLDYLSRSELVSRCLAAGATQDEIAADRSIGGLRKLLDDLMAA
jgi:hypothetical protein